MEYGCKEHAVGGKRGSFSLTGFSSGKVVSYEKKTVSLRVFFFIISDRWFWDKPSIIFHKPKRVLMLKWAVGTKRLWISRRILVDKHQGFPSGVHKEMKVNGPRLGKQVRRPQRRDALSKKCNTQNISRGCALELRVTQDVVLVGSLRRSGWLGAQNTLVLCLWRVEIRCRQRGLYGGERARRARVWPPCVVKDRSHQQRSAQS